MKLVHHNLFQSIKSDRIVEVNHCLRSGSSAKIVCKGHSEHPDGWSPLHEAANRNPLITKILIKYGANCNLAAGKKGTPLHLTPSVDVAKLLIEAGANIEAKNAKGETPLIAQRYLGHQEVVEFLLQQGADDSK